MFESALLAKLISDTALVALVSVYNNAPAIFSESAPDAAVAPYITYDITRNEGGHPSVDRFLINVDYYDRGVSRVNARQASQRIEFLLDESILQHERYDSIRIFRSSGGPIPDNDPLEIHYNNQFVARAGRKAWMAQL